MSFLKQLFGDSSVYRFILVGIVNTLFGTAIMFVFYNVFHLSYWISSASNYFFGSILSYFLNKSFTFRYGKTDYKSILKFTINILVCYLLAYGIAKPVMRHLLSNYSVSIQENVSMALGMILFVGLNYLGQRFFAFKK
jgi:putative flippase GtrA